VLFDNAFRADNIQLSSWIRHMTTSLFRNKDFLGGCLIAALGIGAAIIGRNYPFGSARQMGPGFLPICLSILLVAIGIALALRSLKAGNQLEELGSARPLVVVLAGVIIFSQTLVPLGLVLSSLLLILISSIAQSPFRPKEAVLLAAGLTLGVVALFVVALGIPFRLWPGSL
jgi:hypothetical protein